MCSFVFKLFKKSTEDKHTKTCCVAREHLSQRASVFNYSVHEKHKRTEKARNKK